MHVFLTGEKQVGKSTLITKVLSHLSKFSGVRSVSVFDENGNRNVYLIPAKNNGEVKETGRLVGVCSKHHIIEKHPEVFNEFGVSLLTGSDLVVVDEIGNMERDAVKYADRIRELINQNDVMVLGVLQKMASTDLAEDIRKSGSVEMIEVTQDNRDYLEEIILSKITR